VPTVTASGRPTNAHEIKTLVLSRHPAIAIETSEEERADAALAAVAADTGLVRFDWTVTRGLVRLPATAPVYGTQDAGRMLASIGELGVEGLFVLKDFAAQLAAPPVSRAFRELLERFELTPHLKTEYNELSTGLKQRLALAKALLNRGADTPIDSALEMEAMAFGLVASTEDIFEGIQAFMEKRDPKFKGE